MKFKKNIKKIPGQWYFLMIILLIYAFVLVFEKSLFLQGVGFFYNIFVKIIPIFFIVLVLMSITNYFITPQIISKHLNKKGIKKWFFVIIGGILATGPIYMWYPLLADLKNKGLSYGLIGCFLYNRGIKIPMIPIAVFYFGWQFILVLSFVMVFASILQGLIINKLMEFKK